MTTSSPIKHETLVGGAKFRLTVDSQADCFLGSCVEVGVLRQAGVVTRVHAEDLGDGELRPGVHLRVVVQPHVLAGRVGLSLALQRDGLSLQGRVTSLGHRVRRHLDMGNVRTNCGRNSLFITIIFFNQRTYSKWRFSPKNCSTKMISTHR